MAAITSASIGLAAAGASIYQGEQQKKKAKEEMNSYQRQELDNAFERVGISTVGTDLMREEAQRTTANIVDALQGGGSRGLALLPAVQANTNQVNRQIQKDIDDQIIQRDYAIAGEDSRIMGIKEQRDNQNIAALGSQYMAGEQNMWNGINGAVAAAGSLGGTIGSKSASVPQTRESQTSLSGSIKHPGFQSLTIPAPSQGGFNPLFNAGFQLSPIPKFTTENNMNYKIDM
ncbi:hypothetical protein [Myroides odoratus]|uniref:Uncharacterized protein n=1 Tax=Myroides odoratus TaxID=256 RepID=A0A9Q6ZAT2_MYROD|nr:hypothetical protein [Myroides odoratus]EHQ41535.1 hypothetical protein Myrod_0699 [Myroides odoratus DSM 2801]EKB02768.1 hypothetical protein HMPREF9716_03701 [Myroides odoratus CIP 103059]QQT98955.1 hypothetical protein I6I88_12105 [Myroides odoratus]WQD58858.1 hypothetical protein U0010_06870 [Myroides odoratus]STZ28798.1 Uncharacterised protein [Myroides odoratus]